MIELRMLTDALLNGRSRLYNVASKLFGGRRDMYKSLGYKRVLLPEDYRSRFKRNAVANRVVKALPKATWRGGAEIIEDEEIDKTTTFEQAWLDLSKRLKVWEVFKRADILAGIGRYAVIVIGAPGELDTPLENAGPEEIAYLQPFAEEDAPVETFEADATSERFGLPTFYRLKRTDFTTFAGGHGLPGGMVTPSTGIAKRVHWTRVVHIADGLLDDSIYGEPRLEAIWNDLDDLEKVKGSGAEAFWRRADGGMQFDLDPTLDFNTESKDALKKQLYEYEHDLRKMLLTRGVKVNPISLQVSDFSRPLEAIISVISAGTGIPQRILMGSERGQLASTQDRSNWDDQVTDRRNDYAIPYIIEPFVDRMIELGALPEPQKGAYEVKFSSIRVMDDQQRADIAAKWSSLATPDGQPVVTVDEIRETVLELAPLEEVVSDSVGGGGSTPQDVEERAMLRAMERAIRDDNPVMLQALLGMTPRLARRLKEKK